MAALRASPLTMISRTSAFFINQLKERNTQICLACIAKRSYASSSTNIMNIFDRNAKRHQRNIAAKMPDHHVYDYLKDEVSMAHIQNV